jgi:hypothetical protein
MPENDHLKLQISLHSLIPRVAVCGKTYVEAPFGIKLGPLLWCQWDTMISLIMPTAGCGVSSQKEGAEEVD